jgi:CxxC motif-containing protein
MNKELICIGCPMGCHLRILLEGNNVMTVLGNSCLKGAAYAKNECLNPTRTVTTTVTIEQAMYPLVSVKTAKPIPRKLVRECITFLRQVKVTAPIKAGQVVVENVLNTGVDIIATKDLERVCEQSKQIG